MGPLPSTSTLSTFTASDGDNLAVQEWPLPEGEALRGAVLLVHGLGEHAGRYEALARRLNAWGFAVRGYDQCGHGESAGVRGRIPTNMRLIDDVGDMVDSTRARLPAGLPLILLGHSLGGLVAACHVALQGTSVDALVLSSPALDAGLPGWQRSLLRVLPRAVLNLRVGNGLNADHLSHDPEVVRAYRADPLVHDRISLRLARFIAAAGPRVVARAPRWTVPTLLMYAGSDRLVDPAGSRAFAAGAPPGVVTARCFERMYHEIFNEVRAEPVYQTLKQWLDARFPAAAAGPHAVAPRRPSQPVAARR
jgi:alpha-beta hydrolase superfamily lysophospholipase